ncbi:Mediator of rna polymerase ii transcription subunit 12-like protein [Thalictrum thalictroides]|uniref:Mediator of rna polymerase ii transcription subunit 12-like protein n=1 Tax=Thalictrum thalictroides TaxID=46969 RepID=A0A7J6V789_THATH|nr:Mediator of rna polymerase ii transcription subunit 12-like protein [Thalictrum thalictroides]
MGFDNECILNIQSLAGEYFCPVCRLLVYPNEALQSQCTHLYCKPCLTYIVGSTHACPYDGYLVTEADSKPLIETNKALAESIGKVAVHCLYHRSGCTWQGQLSECITHCTGCAFGNSPVVCNRCGTQIVHRQVQEHAQNCPGVQPQAQQGGVIQEATTATGTTAISEQNQAITQTGVASQAQVAQTVVAPTSAQDQSQVNASSQPQAAVQAVPTPEQWYQLQQQQYQQYYQQYPGYDPYQQQYQQYGQYQQQAFQQQHPPQAIPGQQPQMYMQPQSQTQAQLTVRPQAQLQSQPQTQPQPQPQPQTQTLSHSQAQIGLQHQVQTYPSAHGQQPQQPNQQPPSQLQVQSHLQQRPQAPQSQQLLPQHSQPNQQTQLYPQSQPAGQSHIHPQTQVQQHTHAQMQLQAQGQPPNQLSHAVTGHTPYPQPQPNQQLPSSAPQLQPMYIHPQQQGVPRQVSQQIVQMQSQFPQQQLVQIRPSHSHVPMQQQQHLPVLPTQGQHPNMPAAQLVHPQAHHPNQIVHQYSSVHPSQVQNTGQQHGHSVHPQAFPGQTAGFVQSTPQQPAHFIQQQLPPQLRPQVPPSSLPPASNVHQQLQQNVPISHGLQSHPHNSTGRPMLPNLGVLHQSIRPSLNGPTGPSPAHAILTQPGGIHLYPQGSNVQSQSSATLSGAMNQASSLQSIVKSEAQAESASQKTDVKKAHMLPASSSQGTLLAEPQLVKYENELKPENKKESVDVDEKSVTGGEGKSSSSKTDVKEISESSQLLENNPMSSSQGDEPVDKNMVKEATAKSESFAGDKLVETTAQGQEGISQISKKQAVNSQLEDKEFQKNLSSQQTDIIQQDANVMCQGKVLESEGSNKEVTSLHSNPLQQPHQNFGLAHPSRHSPGQMRQMPVPGQIPTHVRPQGHNMLGNVPSLQGQPSSAPAHFQTSIAKQPLGSFHPEVSPGGIINPGVSSFGRGPTPFGPQGHLNIGQMPHQDGASMGGPAFGVPPPGAFDSQGSNTRRVPPRGQHMPANLESDYVAKMRAGPFDSRQLDLLIPGSGDRVPFGQPSNSQLDSMRVNGSSSRGVSGGLTDPLHQIGLQEERFKHFPEERYRQIPEDERVNSFAVELGRHIHRREFFDDRKHFPGPTHMGPEHLPKSDSYFTVSRPLDRAPPGFTREARLELDVGPNAAVSRPLPPYQAGGFRPIDLRDDISGRNVDHIGHPDFHRSASDLGRFRVDGLPPLRSPGREFSDIPSSRFGRFEDIDGRESRAFGDRSKLCNLPSGSNPFYENRFPSFPSHMRRGEPDVPGNLRIGERVHLRGGNMVGSDVFPVHLRNAGPVGSRNLPSHMHMGEPAGYGTYPIPSRLGDVGGPGNLPLNQRIGEPIGGNLSNHLRPGSTSGMPIHGYSSDNGVFNAGEVESLDHSRKRKHGTMGWCRICKLDCETVEGLEIHSQTREHQKKAMDMVLSIKKDNAKKQKISSDDHISHEGATNNARKASDENHE